MSGGRQAARLRPWTEGEVQSIVDGTLRMESYRGISYSFPLYLGIPFRDAVECRRCLQEGGAAHDFFPELPVYWHHSASAEIDGDVQPDQDTSPLTENETEELILFIYHDRRGVDPSEFKIKRSSAFLSRKVLELQSNDAAVLKIAAKNIEEKRELEGEAACRE